MSDRPPVTSDDPHVIFDRAWERILEHLRKTGMPDDAIWQCTFEAVVNTAIGSGFSRAEFLEAAGELYDEKKALHRSEAN